MKRLSQFVLSLALIAVCMAPVALAETVKISRPIPYVDGKAITLADAVNVFQAVTRLFIITAGIAMVLGIVWSGLRMILARGVPAEFDAAKKQLGQVVVGSLVILAVGLILNTIAEFAKDPAGAITGSSSSNTPTTNSNPNIPGGFDRYNDSVGPQN